MQRNGSETSSTADTSPQATLTSAARTFYQSHECAGFRAKVTIEWSMPEDVDFDRLPSWRTGTAEDIADSILAFSGRKMRDMVQAMRGYAPRTPQEGETPHG